MRQSNILATLSSRCVPVHLSISTINHIPCVLLLTHSLFIISISPPVVYHVWSNFCSQWGIIQYLTHSSEILPMYPVIQSLTCVSLIILVFPNTNPLTSQSFHPPVIHPVVHPVSPTLIPPPVLHPPVSVVTLIIGQPSSLSVMSTSQHHNWVSGMWRMP